jgi:hypothetical protein
VLRAAPDDLALQVLADRIVKPAVKCWKLGACARRPPQKIGAAPWDFCRRLR